MSAIRPNRRLITIPALLAQCVAALVREGREDEINEALRQGRKVGRALGPYAPAGAPPAHETER